MVNFTREPIIESIVTPKEGCKLVIRNSKGVGQDEYFVDALEIVSFGNAIFYRSNEKPKPFLLPITDYEVLEVRDTRLVLKTAPLPKLSKNERSSSKPDRSDRSDRSDKSDSNEESSLPGSVVEVRQEKKRRRSRRKKDRDDKGAEAESSSSKSQESKAQEGKKSSEKPPKSSNPKASNEDQKNSKKKKPVLENPENKEELKKMLVPPPILISDTISRYKDLEENSQLEAQDIPLSITEAKETKLFDNNQPNEEPQKKALIIEENQPATPSAAVSDEKIDS